MNKVLEFFKNDANERVKMQYCQRRYIKRNANEEIRRIINEL